MRRSSKPAAPLLAQTHSAIQSLPLRRRDARQPDLPFDPMPERIEPCLALLKPKAPTGADWLFEIKWDGYRLDCATVAAFCIGLMTPQMFSALFGLVVLVAVILSLSDRQIETTPRTLFTAGAISGFMGTLTSIGSAPMALVYQNAEGARMRATLNAFFVVGSVISIIALAAAGSFDLEHLKIGVFMTPPAMLGFLLSSPLRRLIDRGQVKRMVLLGSALSGAILLWRAFA